MQTDARAAARAVARRQHGAVSIRQLELAGLTRQRVRTLVRSGELSRVAAKVFVVAGSPDTWLRQAMAATLAHPRLRLSHGAAAHLHGFDGFSACPPIEVIGPRGGRPALPSGVVHHVSDVPGRSDGCHVRSVPTMNAAATLCQLPASP